MSYYRNFISNRMITEMDYLSRCGSPIRYEEDSEDPTESRKPEDEEHLKESDQKKQS